MPQMAPLSWLSLMLFFLSVYFLFLIMNYFLIQPQKIQSKKEKLSYLNNLWKW